MRKSIPTTKCLGCNRRMVAHPGRDYCDECLEKHGELPACAHEESIATPDGNGAYCRDCGETLA